MTEPNELHLQIEHTADEALLLGANAVLGTEHGRRWLDAPHPVFDGQTPAAYAQTRSLDAVADYLLTVRNAGSTAVQVERSRSL